MIVRGTCPSLWEPMASGDGLLLRVKPPLGRVDAAAARALAAGCARHGNGTIELTSRGNLQCRGFDAAGARRFALEVVALGLACADPAAERRRTVLTPPDGAMDAAGLAVEAALAGAAELAGLPAKFGVVIDDGSMPAGDVVVRAGSVAAGGLQAAADDPAEAVLRLARALLAVGGGRRMTREGAAAVFGAAGLAASPEVRVRRAAAFGVGLPFGRFDGDVLAGLAERHGAMRLTAWRSVVFEGPTMPVLSRAEREAGLFTEPDDPRRRVFACPGAPACASATVATRAAAAALRPEVTVHVSGCDKGCAHRGAAALTFVGREGRFDLVRDGPAWAVPAVRGLVEVRLP